MEVIEDDLRFLADGQVMTLNGQHEIIHGGPLLFSGDISAAAAGGKFVLENRQCETNFDNMQNKFFENEHLQILGCYDYQCDQLDQAETSGQCSKLSTAYGINRRRKTILGVTQGI